jgi:hypothetical protein
MPENSAEPSDILPWGPLILTPEKVDELWDKISKFPMVFDDFSQGDSGAFIAKLTNPRNVFIDIGGGLGLAAGLNVRPGLDAMLHLVMFDRRLRGRELTFLQIMHYFFITLRLRRMTAVLADSAKTGIKLVQRLGFKHEGTMRGAILLSGEYVDAHIYGFLREEIV